MDTGDPKQQDAPRPAAGGTYRTLDEQQGRLSEAEERFERRRRAIGLFLGPLLLVLVPALPLNLEPEQHRLAAVVMPRSSRRRRAHTASVAIVVPIVIPIAAAAGVDPLIPALAAVFAASYGFMLPVSTPPHSIVYGSGMTCSARSSSRSVSR